MFYKSTLVNKLPIYQYTNFNSFKENSKNNTKNNTNISSKHGLSKDKCCFRGVLDGQGLQQVDPSKLVPVPMDWDESKDGGNMSSSINNTGAFSSFSSKSGVGKITDAIKNMSAKEAVDKVKEIAKDPKGYLKGALGGVIIERATTTSLDDVLNSAKKTAATVREIKDELHGKDTNIPHQNEPLPERFKEVTSKTPPVDEHPWRPPHEEEHPPVVHPPELEHPHIDEEQPPVVHIPELEHPHPEEEHPHIDDADDL